MSIKNMMRVKVRQWGIDVLIVSTSNKIKCKCFDSSVNEGNHDCNMCLGRGYITTVKKERIIVDYNNRLTNTYGPTEQGYQDNQIINIYSTDNISINNGDKIIIVGWNKSKQVSDIKEILTVGSISPYRMENGRIEGIGASCILSNEILDRYSKYFNSMSNRIRKIISDGGVYICPI